MLNRCFTYLAATIIATATVIGFGGCSTNTATGRNQFIAVSSDQVAAMGAEAQPALIQEYGGEVESAELRNYVTDVGLRVAAQVEPEYRDIPWQFFVLDSDVINAFALPGGRVFMSRGLMSKFENEAQLAGVLGHEIGHVVARHVDERLSQAMGLEAAAQIAGVFAGDGGASQYVPLLVGLGGQGYMLKFGRDQESESDILGVRYMSRAGYDPLGMLQVIEVLQAASGGGGQPEFLSTHPHPETRHRTVSELLATDYARTQNNPDYTLGRDRFQRIAAPHLR